MTKTDNIQDHLLTAVQRMRGDRVGRRELQRLREQLIPYTEAKAWIKSQGFEHSHEKRAITLLYRHSGGTKWLTPKQIQQICEEAKA